MVPSKREVDPLILELTCSGVGTEVTVGVGVVVGCGVTVGVGVAVGCGVTVGVGVAVGCGVTVGVGVAVGCGVTVGVAASSPTSSAPASTTVTVAIMAG